MSHIKSALLFPSPKTQVDRDVYNEIQDIVRDIASILNNGLLFEDNFDGLYVDYTSNATPDTEDTVSHGLGRVPTGFLVVNLDKAGIVYDGGTAWTSTNIYLKCNVASVATKIFIF